MRARGSDDGFTVIEMVVALSLIVITVACCSQELITGARVSGDAQRRGIASDVIAGVLERFRVSGSTVAGYNAIPISSGSLPSVTVGGTTYSLTQDTEWVDRGASGSVCDNGSNTSLVLERTVTATWGTKASTSATTFIAPPNGVLNPANGSLGVSVVNSAVPAQPTNGVTVTVTGPGSSTASTSLTTGADGCAFFAQLATGTYTVSLAMGASGVSNNQQTPYTTTTTVAAGVVDQLTGLYFDAGGQVAASFTPTNLTPATGLPVSIDDVAVTATNDNLFRIPSASTWVFPGTFPIFAGACTDADPNGQNKSAANFYTPAQVGTWPSVTVTSGNLAAPSVPLFALALQLTKDGSNLTGVTSSTITAIEDSGQATESGDGVCPSPVSVGLVGAAANGTSTTGVGLGHWSISASVTAGGHTYTTPHPVEVWVQPGGTYAVDGNGAQQSLSSTPVPVPVH